MAICLHCAKPHADDGLNCTYCGEKDWLKWEDFLLIPLLRENNLV